MTETIDAVPFGLIAVLAAFGVAYAVAYVAHARGSIALSDVTNRIGCIDGLRGYLALSVAMHHFLIWMRHRTGAPWEAPPSNIFNNFGQAAVVLFFMITGALFYARVLAAVQPPLQTGPARRPINWYQLYVSRVFRLVPLYWFGVALVIVISILRGPGDIATPAHFAGALLKWAAFLGQPDIGGFHPSGEIIAYVPWSLQYEWMFYAALPFLALALSLAVRFGLPTVGVPLALLALSAVEGNVSGGQHLKFVASFALGMLAIEASLRPRIAQALRTRAVALLGLAALALELTYYPGAMMLSPNLLLAVFFLPVVSGNSYFTLLRRHASIVLGDLSYSIYLLHGIVLSLFMTEGLNALGWSVSPALWFALPVLSGVIVGIALLTYRTIEKPAIEAGKTVGRRVVAVGA
jgi:peptidoglycan/LPS O-acetylase OafA/YrhL